MKKRIVCFLLTLIMLVGLMPLSASAATMAVNEQAITVLKQIQTYSKTCTQYGTEWRNGYGTICTKSGDHSTHTIQETDADRALRTKLKELDTAVNSFASGAGLSLSQNQHDALVLFTYDAGTSWMNGTSVLRSAIVNKAGAGELLNAMVTYNDGTNAELGMEASRRVIANMYLNGVYSNVPPSNYEKVTYKVKDGMMAQGKSEGGYLVYTTYFDASENANHTAIPTRIAYKFLGWYTSEAEGEGKWVPNLNADCVNATLYAKWQKDGITYKDAVAVNYELKKASLASRTIYDIPDTDDAEAYEEKVESTFQVDHDFIGADGTRWAHGTSEAGITGWVIVRAGTNGVPEDGIEIDVTVTVTNSYVNMRKNATIYSAQNGRWNQGDELRIINTASADGFVWGQVAQSEDDNTPIGWVALVYTNWNSVKDEASGSGANSNAIATAIVSCSGFLNVRKDAGTDNAIVGALANGDCVDIYEIKFVNGHKWGRTSEGWILLTYAKVEMLDSDLDYSTSADVLAYTFTGTLKRDVTPHVDVSETASNAYGKTLPAGTLVAVSMVKNDAEGNIWGFNGTGWIKLEDVNMDIAKYVVVADSVTVRKEASASAASVEKVVKGVELDIDTIKVVDATIWGFTAKYNGWVNLASKYVTRSNAPIIENAEGEEETGLIATVVNTDSVRVRNYGATYGKAIGSLARGTTVKVWESNDNNWYKIDTNQNGVYDYDDDGWVFGGYLDVYEGTIGDDSDEYSGSGSGSTNTGATVETGLGIVANTYSGVNIRQGAGTGYAAVGKYLNGTSVEILEVTSTATSKWGRTDKGWVCMDYITMISKYPIGGAVEDTNSNAGQNAGGSTSSTEGNTSIDRTPAVYAGRTTMAVDIKKTYDEDALVVRTMGALENITIQELVKVTTKTTITEGTVIDGDGSTETSTVVTKTTYWARVNDGWIANPEDSLALNDLDEIIYTVANVDQVNVRDSAGGNIFTTLKKGTQVAVTTLQIVGDKIWGYVEDVGTSGGWIRLDNLSEGAITVKDETAPAATTPPAPTIGSTGNTGTGGFVTNTSGYKYTGKVIRNGTTTLKVRATPSTSATVTTELNSGASLVIYETTIAESMAWGRCDAGWVYLYYVDLTPSSGSAIDAKVVYNENTIAYTDSNCSEVAGTYSRMSVVDIYEVVGKMARTDLGWVNTDNLA